MVADGGVWSIADQLHYQDVVVSEEGDGYGPCNLEGREEERKWRFSGIIKLEAFAVHVPGCVGFVAVLRVYANLILNAM